jgi:hypothetical protein
MPAEQVKENVACGYGEDRTEVEPEKHSVVVFGPEPGAHPMHEAAVHQSLVEQVDHIRGEERPGNKVKRHLNHSPARIWRGPIVESPGTT